MNTAFRGCIALVLLAGVARAQDTWTLTTADLKTESVVLKSIAEAGVTVAAPDGAERVVPMTSFVQLGRGQRSKSPAGLVLCVTGGARLVGTPRRMDGPNLIWFTNGVGDVAVLLESVLAVLRDRTTVQGLADARPDDQAKLVSGDSVRGILTDATDSAFVFAPAAGEPVSVAPMAVASILFASPPGGRKAVAPSAFLVRVAGGSAVACQEVVVAKERLTLRTSAGTDIDVPLAQIESIEHTGGPLAWLSAREPTESVHTPYLDGDFPARFDSSVVGRPIRFGGVTYAHGIGVHSRSKLVFALQPGDSRFRTRYAIDGNADGADVDVRVLADDRIVHEIKGFRSGVLSPLIEVDLAGVKTLTLEVDYGQGYDVQDRLNWIEPAVLRKAN